MKETTAVSLGSLRGRLEATPLTRRTDAPVEGCYISDLLSDVLAHAQPGVLWVTIQTHRNVVSVASMKDTGAVLITCGRKPDAATIAEADKAGLVILSTPLTTYEAAARVWEAGIR